MGRYLLFPLAMLTSGCVIGTTVKPPDEPLQPYEDGLYTAVCGDSLVSSNMTIYTISVTVNMETVVPCFGDPNNPNFEADVDAALAPDWSYLDHECDAYTCTFTVTQPSGFLTFVPSNECGCHEVNLSEDDPHDCCSYSSASSTWDNTQDDVVEVLNDACWSTGGMSAPSGQPPLPESGEPPFNNAEWDYCGDFEQITDSAADYNLSIDPATSHVTITSGTESLFSPVVGSGAAATGPARFLKAGMRAADASLGATDYDDWFLWLDDTVALDVQTGAFTIDPNGAPLLKGYGRIDGVEHLATMGMGAIASGAFDTTNHTWYLDYTESDVSGTVSVHLEGDITLP